MALLSLIPMSSHLKLATCVQAPTKATNPISTAHAYARPRASSSGCMSRDTRISRSQGCRTRQRVSSSQMLHTTQASLKEMNFATHFHSLGVFPFLSHSFKVLFHKLRSFSVRVWVLSSAQRGRKSSLSKGRLNPVLRVLFIHQKVKMERKLADSRGWELFVSPSFRSSPTTFS